MYKTSREAQMFAQELEGYKNTLGKPNVEALICTPFTALYGLHDRLAQVYVKLGAQTMHEEIQGAFTGEVSAAMLQDVGCDYVILGHSERRQYFAESDAAVAKKALVALAAGIVPIVCVGETLSEREAGETRAVVSRQVNAVLELLQTRASQSGLSEAELVVAYEPIWAIGTGKSSSTSDAQDVAAWIRSLVKTALGEQTAERVRVLYGGSVKPENIKLYVEQPDIDGALIGGASLQPASFVALVEQVSVLS